MTSRFCGPSTAKEGPQKGGFGRDHFHMAEPQVFQHSSSTRSQKNGQRSENSYHFGMSRNEDRQVIDKNGRAGGGSPSKDHSPEDPDFLYKRSKDHFASWDIRDLDNTKRSTKLTCDYPEDHHRSGLTNGKSRDSSKVEKRSDSRDEGYAGSLPREDRGSRAEVLNKDYSMNHKSRRREAHETQDNGRARSRSSRATRGPGNDAKDESRHRSVDRDEPPPDPPVRELEGLRIEGAKSPDRRISAMIERLKSREQESKLMRSRRDREASGERQEADDGEDEVERMARVVERTRITRHSPLKSGGAGVGGNCLESGTDERVDRIKVQREDREEDRRTGGRCKLPEKEVERQEQQQIGATRTDRSIDRRRSRSIEKREELPDDKVDDGRRRTVDSFRRDRKESRGAERSDRRRSREVEDDHVRVRDSSSKRRSHMYEGSPEEFDVRLEKYERALLEPRRDPEVTKKSSLKDDRDSSRKDSFGDYDREVTRRSSFKDDRDSSRKDSFAEYDRETTRISSFKDDRDFSRKDSFKHYDKELTRKSSFKDDRDSSKKDSFRDYDRETTRISSFKDDRDFSRKDSFKDYDKEVIRKSSFKNPESSRRASSRDRESEQHVRTSFKDQEAESCRKNSFKDTSEQSNRYSARDRKDGLGRRDSLKDQTGDLNRKSSFKGQTIEFGRVPYKDQADDVDTRAYKVHNTGRITFKAIDEECARKTAYKDQDSGVGRVITFKEQDVELARRNSFKDHDSEVARIIYKSPDDSLERRHTAKEKSVEFGKITYKDADVELPRKNSFKDQDQDFGRVSFKDREDQTNQRSNLNDRYVEFGKVSFKHPEPEPISRSTVKDQENELGRRNSFKHQDPSPRRRTSLRNRTREDKKPERSDRYSRPLTPPNKQDDKDLKDHSHDDPGKDRERSFSPRTWHESNRLFSARYLRDNSKVNNTSPDRITGIPAQDHQDTERPWQDNRFLESDGEEYEEHRSTTRLNGSNRESRFSSTRERNGTTIIRIRSTPDEATTSVVERRRRRRPQDLAAAVHRRRRFGREDEHGVEDEDSDEDEDENEEEQGLKNLRRRRARKQDAAGLVSGRGGPTPSRRLWNYREGGVLITDVEEGQPCLDCGKTCSGFSPHTWRKNCTSCKCPREAHDVCHEEWVSVRSRLGLKGDEPSGPIGFDPRERGIAWAPPGLPPDKVEEYFAMLPELNVPRLGTPGERHRDRQLAIQLPKQDLARAYCRHLDPKHSTSADDFMAARNEIALDIGSVQEVLDRDVECGACIERLEYGSLAVSASKLGLFYHPSCFRCADCQELLVDLAYCVHDDTLFCERHYAEQLKPRCAACDELIFSGEYTKAMNKDWHSGHFCCWQCDESLTGQRYVLRDEHPYCIKCYESVFANGCEECNKIIGIDSKDLSYKDKHWHEACFLCNRCRVSLVDKQFGSKVDKIYCGNCYDAQFASRCDGCGEIFRAGTKKMEYKTRQWHEKCFCCVVCKNPIGTKSFIPREQEIYCAGCYEDKFATRCVKCNKIITSGGVTYKNEPWHRDCFTCSNCNNSLAGQRFTSRDDKPYCADCFGELFAKRCTACSKPITGIGGTRFISFEDRHWHNDCFICAGCKVSLVGRGFITDNEDIICPECAKQKLM